MVAASATTPRLLLTGATGFFGRALLRWLSGQTDGKGFPRVTAVTRDPRRFQVDHPELAAYPWLEFHQGDICERNTLPFAESFTHVLHGAADSTRGPELRPLQRYDQIVLGTRNVLDLAITCGAQRFLLTSSGAVYGPQAAHLEGLPETWSGCLDPSLAANAYGAGKYAAEHLCQLYRDQYGLEVVIARCFAFVGEDLPMRAHFAIGNFIYDALHEPEIRVSGNGRPVRSYLYQSDLAQWLWKMLHEGASGRVYNVGSDQAITIADLARLVGAIIAPEKPMRILDPAAPTGPRSRYVPDIQRARTELNLGVSIDLREAIEATWLRLLRGARN